MRATVRIPATNPFAAELKKIAAFSPHLLVIALFQHSFLDEIFLYQIPKRLKVAGFDPLMPFGAQKQGYDATRRWPSASIFGSRLKPASRVGEELLACLRNPGIRCSQTNRREFLRHRKQSTTPVRFFYSTSSARGRVLGRVCGFRPGLEIKDWGEARWVAALSRNCIGNKGSLPFSETRAEAPRLDEFKTRCQMTCGISISRPTHSPS